MGEKLNFNEVFNSAVKFHMARKFEAAEHYYNIILEQQPEHPVTNHNMGILWVNNNRIQKSIPFFKRAINANPDVEQFWISYINALLKIELLDDAKAALDIARSYGFKDNIFQKIERDLERSFLPSNKSNFKEQDPPKEQLQNLLDLYNQKYFNKALKQASFLLKKFPNSPNIYNILGAINLGLSRYDEAISSYRTAIYIKPSFLEAHNNIGVALKEQGKIDEAIKAYKDAIKGNSGYVEAHYNLGNALKEQGKIDEAIKAYKDAIKGDPDYVEVYNNLGVALKDIGEIRAAIDAFESALSIKSDYIDVWSNGAELLEKWNKLEELDAWLKRARRAFKSVPPDIKYMQAKSLWRQKDYEKAKKIIFDLELESITYIWKQDFLNLRAKCFEKIHDFDNAYNSILLMNSYTKSSEEYELFYPEKYFKSIKNNLTKLKRKPFLQLQKLKERTDFKPFFLVGFPRSGTTLLDTILRSHSEIQVIEEKPCLTKVKHFLIEKGYADPANDEVTKKALLKARGIYKKEFNHHVDNKELGSVFIDKYPLNLLDAHLIHKLYPDAKFIFAIRHPMDTILSCWMQNFKLNRAMANMVDLDRIVQFYCIAMETFKICRSRHKLNVHEIRYEDLLDSFFEEISATLAFVNTEWEPQIESYTETAFKRERIRTPSYSQVIEPIYDDAKYRWLNYKKYLDQYLDQISVWINEFGYENH